MFVFSVCRVTPVLGYQPQDLLGKSAYDFYHPEDQAHMKESFDQGESNRKNSLIVYLKDRNKRLMVV